MPCCSSTGPNGAGPSQACRLCITLLTGDPKLDIVQPAVEGTKTVLQAAAKQKANGLQRVVVTSSVCGEPAYQQLQARVAFAMSCMQKEGSQLSNTFPDCKPCMS